LLVVNRIEECAGELQPIPAWLLGCLDRPPAPVGGAVEPRVVRHGAGVQDCSQRERQHRSWPGLEPGRVRVVLEAGQRRRDSAVWLGDPREPAPRVAGHLALGRARLVEDLERVQRRRWLAAGAA
jgi:hypothetical protein